jgi:hypothetical protein
MSKIRRCSLLTIAVFLSVTLAVGFTPAAGVGAWFGATPDAGAGGDAASGAGLGAGPDAWGAYVAYADDDEPQPLEDCDFDCYDDHTGVPVPWAGYDETRGDTIPDDWDGVAGSYQAQHDAELDANLGTGGGTGGNGSGGGSNNGSGNGAGGNGSNDGTSNGANGGSGDGSNNGTGGNGSGDGTGNGSGGGTETIKSPSPSADDKTGTGQNGKNTKALKFAKSPSPKITGTAKVGKTLKVKAGTWNPKPKIKYQWYANGKAIKGATKAAYKLKKAQKGKRITVKITATKSGYNTVTKTSGKTAKVK